MSFGVFFVNLCFALAVLLEKISARRPDRLTDVTGHSHRTQGLSPNRSISSDLPFVALVQPPSARLVPYRQHLELLKYLRFSSSVHICRDSVVSPSSGKLFVFRLRSLTANSSSSSSSSSFAELRVQQRTVDVPMPQVQEETFEVVRFVPHDGGATGDRIANCGCA